MTTLTYVPPNPKIVDDYAFALGQVGTLVCLVYDLYTHKMVMHYSGYRVSEGSDIGPKMLVSKREGRDTVAIRIGRVGQYELRRVKTKKPVPHFGEPEFRNYAIMYTVPELVDKHLGRFWKQIARHHERETLKARRGARRLQPMYPPVNPIVV